MDKQYPYRKVCMIGLGYIGLPTAATLAGRKVEVVGVDVNPMVVDKINKGQIHIVEPELDVLVNAVVLGGKLRAVTEPEKADAYIIAVPTPLGEGAKPDMSYVFSAMKAIAPLLEPGALVLLESTSAVGSTEKLVALTTELRPDLNLPLSRQAEGDVAFAHCPERVLPGQVIRELVANDRVIGGYYPGDAERARDLYQIFVKGQIRLTDCRTAELTKLVENAFRDVNIAFANELSLICAELGVDVWELIELANLNPRVNILKPGPGVGGHCIAVDPWFIVDAAPKQSQLISMARQVNDSKPGWVVDKVARAADKFKRPVVCCLGLAFKANVDDLRESPSVDIVRRLAQYEDYTLLVVEPYIQELPKALADCVNVRLVGLDGALERSDIVVMLTDHDVFKAAPAETLREKIVIDTRGAWR